MSTPNIGMPNSEKDLGTFLVHHPERVSIIDLQSLRDAEKHVPPLRHIIAAPVAGIFTASRELGSANDKWTLAREYIEQGVVRGVQDLMAVSISYLMVQTLETPLTRTGCVHRIQPLHHGGSHWE